RVSARSIPESTMLYSSNSGVCPGSIQPPGLRIRAMLAWAVCELTRPMNSSITFGLLPAALMIVGFGMCLGMLEDSLPMQNDLADSRARREVPHRLGHALDRIARCDDRFELAGAVKVQQFLPPLFDFRRIHLAIVTPMQTDDAIVLHQDVIPF